MAAYRHGRRVIAAPWSRLPCAVRPAFSGHYTIAGRLRAMDEIRRIMHKT